MNVNDFWKIIEVGKNADQPEEILEELLSGLSPEQIHLFATYFENMFDKAYRWDIWCAAYLLDGGCSDDGFIYFVRGLISKGRDVYENAVRDPNSLIEFLNAPCVQNEMFGCVAREVYEKITGSELPYDDHPAASTSYEWHGKYSMREDNWDFEDELQNRTHLPQFCKVYYAKQ